MAEKRPALGRGLSALIPDAPPPAASGERALDVDTDLLRPNKFQPRTSMDEAKIDELARSIRANGIIQPIVVRKVGRRLRDRRRRAALARLAARRPPQGPRRRPRHPRGSAARRRAHREHSARGSQSDRGSARVPAARRRVPPDAGTDRRRRRQGSIVDRQLPAAAEAPAGGPRESSARARCRWGTRARCSALPDEAAQLRVVARRRHEEPVGARNRSARAERRRSRAAAKAAPDKDVHTRAAEERLRFALGTRVRIVRKRKGGRIEIDFASEDELSGCSKR